MSRDGLIGLLHELATDRPSGLQLLDGAAELLFGVEQALFEIGDVLCQLPVGQFGEHALGQEVVGHEPGTLGVGQPLLQASKLAGEAMVLGAAVRQVGPQGGTLTRAEEITSLAWPWVARATLSSISARRSGWS